MASMPGMTVLAGPFPARRRVHWRTRPGAEPTKAEGEAHRDPLSPVLRSPGERDDGSGTARSQRNEVDRPCDSLRTDRAHPPTGRLRSRQGRAPADISDRSVVHGITPTNADAISSDRS